MIGEDLTWGFDLAAALDVDELWSLLRQVSDSTNKAVSVWTVGQNLITRVTKLTISRFDKIDALLNLTRRSLIEKSRRLQYFKTSDYASQRLTIIITQKLGDLISQMHEVESFYLVMKDLAQQRLSHHLVETKILQDHLNFLSDTVKAHNPQTKLVYPYVHYYYIQGRVASAMLKYLDKSILVVIIHVPLTRAELTAPMSIYHIHTFPLLSPDGESYHTILTAAPKFIIYNSLNSYYSAVNESQDLPCTKYKSYRYLFKIPNQNMLLHSINDSSCAMSLFLDDLTAIKKQCIYHVVFEPLKPAVYQISPDKFFLTNVSSLHVKRQGRISPDESEFIKQISNISIKIKTNATQSVYTIPCESTAFALGNLYLSREFCNDWSSETQMNVTYPYNVLIFASFFFKLHITERRYRSFKAGLRTESSNI